MVDEAGCSSAWWDSAQPDQADDAWKRDVALEMWIDARFAPVRIRLAGSLERATVGRLVSAVQDLLHDGCRDFKLDTSAVHASDRSGARALTDLSRLVRRSGGRLTWTGSTTTSTRPARGKLVGF